MEDQESAFLNRISEVLEQLLMGEVPGELDCSSCKSDDLNDTCERMNRLIRAYADANHFLLALSEGRLDVDVPPRNFLISHFKQLHSNLKHLTWQARQIARGDLNQHVDFLGEFSVSFNSLIASLREKRVIEEELKRSEKKLKDITSALGEGVYVLNAQGELAFMNPEAERLLGWTEEELLGRRIHGIIHSHKPDGTMNPEADCPLIKTIRTGEINRVHEDTFIRKDGSFIPVSLVSTAVKEDGRVVGCVAAFHDITVRKRAQEALQRANELLEHQATTDALTGIPNRLKFKNSMAKEINRAKRHRLPLSIILFDIDHFKEINDTYGHHIGDLVLQEMAKLVSATLRNVDVFARWGGEEFILLLPDSDLNDGKQLAERLRSDIEGNKFNAVKKITCSFGVARFNTEEEAENCILRADQALYRAKRGGRNMVVTEESNSNKP